MLAVGPMGEPALESPAQRRAARTSSRATAIEDPTDTVVRADATTICDSDMRIRHGDLPEVKPDAGATMPQSTTAFDTLSKLPAKPDDFELPHVREGDAAPGGGCPRRRRASTAHSSFDRKRRTPVDMVSDDIRCVVI